jgi:hypothetical protein
MSMAAWAPGIILTDMRTLIFTALTSWLLTAAQSTKQLIMQTQQTDSVAIARILENEYFRGIYEGDVPALRNIYHPGTLLFGDVKGQPYAKTLPEYLDGVQHRQSPKDSGKPFKGSILEIKVVNTIAVAEVKVKMYDFHYHEFLSFHQLNGKWLIVNKMISDLSE